MISKNKKRIIKYLLLHDKYNTSEISYFRFFKKYDLLEILEAREFLNNQKTKFNIKDKK